MCTRKEVVFVNFFKNLFLDYLGCEDVRVENMENKRTKIEKLEAFIASYEREECLWNACFSDYNNKTLKIAAIDRLKNEFDMSGK